jgi:CheY-like chemotaxis protein
MLAAHAVKSPCANHESTRHTNFSISFHSSLSTSEFHRERNLMSRILVVDDEFYVRSFLKRTLERLGHTVTEATNGREAMAVFLSFKPVCVITDLLMPEQEGMETILAMRRQSRAVRIIAISGSFHPMVSVFLKTAGHLGADAVLSKPFSINRLVEAIGSLERAEPATENQQFFADEHDRSGTG